MNGLTCHSLPFLPPEVGKVFAWAKAQPDRFVGLRLRRGELEEIWRYWSLLSEAKRSEVRDILWRTGVTGRLTSAVSGRRGRRRAWALQRLLQLSDLRTVACILAQWPRLTRKEREMALAVATRADYPGLVHFLWREVAKHSIDVVEEMCRLVRRLGPSRLIPAIGRALHEKGSREWAWQVLIRLADLGALEHLLSCLGRLDELGGWAKNFFSSAPADDVLSLLMRTARFHASWEVRVGAVVALLRRKEPQTLSFLSELLRDRGWYMDKAHGYAPSWPELFGLDRMEERVEERR